MQTKHILKNKVPVFKYFFLIFSLIFLSVPAISQAQVVTNLNNDGPGSLREVIAGAAPGSTISFDPSINGGTITLNTEIIIDKDLTINGPGAGLLTISGGNNSRIFRIIAPASNLTISDLRLANGFVQDGDGGAILVEADSNNLRFDRCVFESNRAECVDTDCDGAAIATVAGPSSIEMSDCSFRSNNTTCSGGDCSASGGAVRIGAGNTDLTIVNTIFYSNSASCSGEDCSADGSGLSLGGGSSNFVILDSTFESNSASCSGDECKVFASAVTSGAGSVSSEVTGTTFDSNSSSCSGESCEALGAAYYVGGGSSDFSFTNSTFTSNSTICTGQSCRSLGGAISNGAGGITMNISFSTFSSNLSMCGGPECLAEGASLHNTRSSSVLNLNSSIFYTESPAGNCGGIEINSLGYNIDNGSSCLSGSAEGDKPNTDPGLSPAGLQNNGGPTKTIALREESPAIDMADPACPPPSTDQRGVNRPQGISCDIGAFELLISRPIPTLSEWGMIALATAMGVFGIFYAVRRRTAADT